MCAHNERIYVLDVNGFQVDAAYKPSEEALIDWTIDHLMSLRQKKAQDGGEKTIAFFSGPPGAGKSTLALSVCKRAEERKTAYSFECLGLDGFHKRRDVLLNTYTEKDGRRINLNDIKGAPETFDAETFCNSLFGVKTRKSVLWPVYDRRIHDVSDEMKKVSGDILLIEGNWLTLSGIWAKAREMCDITFSVDADDMLLKERLIGRKVRGGKTMEEAVDWFKRVDGPNIRLYRKESVPSDVGFIRKNGILLLSHKKI
ncbi:MAG: hypothetical protein IKJ65_10180 [Clostridia bacterium]|nr:hypothetical protein [Clostridia bacterium]